MRHTHTITTKKAKCLNYRAGKRCGRLARFLVSGTSADPHGQGRHQHYNRPVCADCKDALIKRDGAEIAEHSEKGFTVKVALFGLPAREYTAIERLCINCNKLPVSKVEKFCRVCGQSNADLEDLEMLLVAADNVEW